MARNSVKIIQWNARSINANKGSLEYLLNEYKIDVAAISESWLKPGLEFKISQFNVVRKDRNDGKGGSLLLINKIYDYTPLNFIYTYDVQICGAIVHFNENFRVTIISIYCKPGYLLTAAEWSQLIRGVNHPLVILGDFNAKSIIWGCVLDDRQGEELANFTDSLDLVSLNDGSPTRLNFQSDVASIVDVSFCSAYLAPSLIWRTLEDSMGSDHFPILITRDTYLPNREAGFTPKFITEKADWNRYQEEIVQKLLRVPSFSSTNAKYEFVEKVILEAATQSIPLTKQYGGKHPPMCWWNSECDKAIKNRKQAHVLYKNNPILENWLNLKKSQAAAKSIIKKSKRQCWEQFCTSINPTTPSRDLWAKVKKMQGISKSNKRNPSNEVLEQFLDKIAPPWVPHSNLFLENTNPNGYDILETNFSFNELERALYSLPNTAPGLDKISYAMIQKLPYLALILVLEIFNEIRVYNNIPTAWKKQLILPILKPGYSASEGQSYRPIALSSCIAKVYEKLIKFRLENYLETYHKLPNSSFGFRTTYSTMDSLAILISNIQESYALKKYTPAAFIDIEGAYDNIDVHILCTKLRMLGVGPILERFIFEYFFGRNIVVKTSNQGLFTRTLYKGVPQGSILSPILFICYTHDLQNHINPHCKLIQYADDLVIYDSTKSLEQGISNLDDSVSSLKLYLTQNSFNIKASKSAVCIFSKRKIPPWNAITLGGEEFKISAQVKYLGLFLDAKLLWKNHISYIVQKCTEKLKLLKIVSRFSWGANPQSLLLIYRAMIRSVIEYGSFLYGSASSSTLQKLEKIQFQAVRQCMGYLRTSPTNAILIESNEPPLELRRNLLAGKFVAMRYSKFYHPSVVAVASLHDTQQATNQWTRPNLPPLVLAYANLKNSGIQIQKYSLPPIFQIDAAAINFKPRICITPEMQPIPLSSHVIYTDGSKSANDIGCSFFDERLTVFNLIKLPAALSVFSAELIAIREAIIYSRNNQISSTIMSDSKSALQAIKSINMQRKISKLPLDIFLLLKEAAREGVIISLHWVKGHSTCKGNHIADYLAKRASHSGQILNEGVPWQDYIATIKSNILKDWKDSWNLTSQIKGSFLHNIKPTPGHPWFKAFPSLPRSAITLFNRLRINHTRSNAHLFRFHIVNSPICNFCLNEATNYHLIFNCIQFMASRTNLIAAIEPHFRDPTNLIQILQNPKEAVILAIDSFIKENKIIL